MNTRELGSLIRRREWVITVGVVAGLLILTVTAPDYLLNDWSLWAIFGLLALSFTFVWGHGGIFSFGQAAFFGIGGYAYAIASIDLSPTTGETISALVLGALAAAAAASVLGYFMFYGNVGDIYVAIITLASTLVLLTFMSSTADPKYHLGGALLGGYNGMTAIPPVMYGSEGFLGTRSFFLACSLVAVAAVLGLRFLLRRPLGRVIAGVRENELRTMLLGYDIRRYKLIAFALGGAVAGLAGALYAAWGMFLDPTVFSLSQAAMVAIWVLVGGRSSLPGAFVGVVIVEGISSALGGSGGTATPIVLGGILIIVVLLLPDGVVPALGRLFRFRPEAKQRRTSRGEGSEVAHSGADALRALLSERSQATRAGASLRGEALSKNFGGVQALSDIDIAVQRREIKTLIGPNGAGKSTCFNLLVGRYAPTSGRVFLDDRDVTRLRPDERARLGMGIKLQVPSYYSNLSVFENLWLAAFARFRDVARADGQAHAAAAWLNFRDVLQTPAGSLSHGQHQWLELGMVVASSPQVMLLDEPTAGMTRAETERTVEMIRSVNHFATVVVVEHDMEFLRSLDAPVVMFHQGRMFAAGTVQELRSDERVLDTYLGRGVSLDA